MTWRGRWTALLVAFLLVSSGAATHAVAAPSEPPQTWPGRPQPGPRNHPKLSPALDPAISGGLQAQSAIAPPDASGTVLVQVQGSDTAALRAAVEAVDGEVRTSSPTSVVANVTQAQLGALADDGRVERVIPPPTLRPDATSEGVDNTGINRTGATGAKTWQNAGRDGTGVKVGIVDVGFDGYQAASASGGLPPLAAITTANFCGPGVVGFDGRGPNGTDPPINHGTAVAEIVHQMAPKASLYLVCVFTDADMTSAAQYLAGQGVKIVNASIGDVLGGRGDGTGAAGSPAAAVAVGRQAGQLWSVSTGNGAGSHYQFTAFDRDNDGAVESVGTAPTPGLDGTETYSFTLGASATANVAMKWDAWPTTNQTYDLCFYQDTVSTFLGCGNVYPSPGEPIQRAIFQNTTGGQHTYLMVIFRHDPSVTITPRVDVYFEGQEQNLQAVRLDGSVTEPATSPLVMAMGAHCYANGISEPYSSHGPTIDGRIKPDLSGPDGVSNDVVSGQVPGLCNNHLGFYGTSAAAPHGAGAAALVKGALPGLGAAEIQQLLQDRAVDAGAGGRDNQFGSGRLNLGPLTYTTSATSGPAAASSGAGKTTVIVRGSDNGLWQLNQPASRPLATSWTPLGGFATSDPDVSSWGDNRLDVFVRGGDNALWHRASTDGVTWLPWESLGGVLTSGPAAVSWSPSRIDVFVRGSDGALWSRALNGGTWTGWYSLGGFLLGDPDVASWGPNRLDVFVRGGDNALWHLVWNGVRWLTWEGLGGVFSAAPGSVGRSANRLDVLVRGTDNAMWWKSWNGSAWSGWSSLGGGLSSGPDAASPSSSRVDVVVTAPDARVWQQSLNSGVPSGWSPIGPY